MRFWLASFVLVFVAVELFDWFAALGSWHPTGGWLVLGGMGLAVLSNRSALPPSEITLTTAASDRAVEDSEGAMQAPNKQNKATGSKNSVAQVSAKKEQKIQPLAEDKDSILFKVRPLKR